MSIATKLNMQVKQMDVCNAFLNAEIEDDVYLKLPQGMTNHKDYNDNVIYKLNKSLYGLRGSPKSWNKVFDSIMSSQGFTKSKKDNCLYTKFNGDVKVFLLLYVDDILYTSNSKDEMEKLKNVLANSFKIKDMGNVSKYLGIQVEQDLKKGVTKINQSEYLKGVLEHYNMLDCKPLSLPIDKNFKFSLLNRERSESKTIESKCRKLIGCLIYAVIGTRPDICAVVTMLSRYQSCASELLFKLLKNVLRYIKGTIDLCLVYKRDDNNTIEGYVDSDWGGCPKDRKSTTGYCFKVYNCTVIWCSKKQPAVAMSTAESELIALSSATVMTRERMYTLASLTTKKHLTE
jgi:hypothetical protein